MHEILLGENRQVYDIEWGVWGFFSELSLLKRIIFFLLFFFLWIIYLLLSLFAIPKIFVGNIKSFGFRYSLSNLFLLLSFCTTLNPYERLRGIYYNDSYFFSEKTIFFSCLICIIFSILSCLFFPYFFLITLFMIVQIIIFFTYIMCRFDRIRSFVLSIYSFHY